MGTRLIYEIYHPGRIEKGVPSALADMMKRQEISSIYIISSEIVDSDEYLGFADSFVQRGFTVRNLHVSRTVFERPSNVMKIVAEISNTFNRESCLVLSYGDSHALLIVACYYVMGGHTPSRAILRVSRFSPDFSTRVEETACVYLFKKYINSLAEDPRK